MSAASRASGLWAWLMDVFWAGCEIVGIVVIGVIAVVIFLLSADRLELRWVKPVERTHLSACQLQGGENAVEIDNQCRLKNGKPWKN